MILLIAIIVLLLLLFCGICFSISSYILFIYLPNSTDDLNLTDDPNYTDIPNSSPPPPSPPQPTPSPSSSQPTPSSSPPQPTPSPSSSQPTPSPSPPQPMSALAPPSRPRINCSAMTWRPNRAYSCDLIATNCNTTIDDWGYLCLDPGTSMSLYRDGRGALQPISKYKMSELIKIAEENNILLIDERGERKKAKKLYDDIKDFDMSKCSFQQIMEGSERGGMAKCANHTPVHGGGL